MTTPPQTGIHVLIVGAGFGGLATSIECVRKGHRVTILEAVPELEPLGDIISLASNAGRIIERWPGVKDKMHAVCHHSDRLHLRLYNGEYLLAQIWEKNDWGPKFNGHRAELHGIIFEHARSVGVNVRMGCKAVGFLEGEGNAAVILEGGEKVEGDVVIGADGLHSVARPYVLGRESVPRSSGYAVWRSWFDAEEVGRNELTRFLVEDGDYHGAWLGPDVHLLAASVKNGKDICWVCTHKDENHPNSEDKEYILRTLEGYDPAVHELIKVTPPNRIYDWKLVVYDTLPTWVSPQGRVALAGDAAHSFLPTSIQGGSQAIEDGVTIAVCLQLAGKEKIPLAMRAYEKIRYDRVKAAQATGVSTRDRWHKADFANTVRSNPESVRLPRHEFLLNFDAEKEAYLRFEEVAKELKS